MKGRARHWATDPKRDRPLKDRRSSLPSSGGVEAASTLTVTRTKGFGGLILRDRRMAHRAPGSTVAPGLDRRGHHSEQEPTVNTTTTPTTAVRRAAATAVLVGAAVLAAAPAHAAPAPEDTSSGRPWKALIEHRESEWRALEAQREAQRDAQATQQQAYLDGLGSSARQDAAAAREARAAFAAQQRSYAEHWAQAAQKSRSDASGAESASSAGSGDTGDGVPIPVAALLAFLGGGLVTGAAGFTVYRYRHHGPVGAATA